MRPAPLAARVVVVAGTGWVAAGIGGALAGGIVAAALPWWRDRRRDRTAGRRLDDDLATIVELAARASRSGLSLPQALRESSAAVGGPAGGLIDALLRLAGTLPLQAACRTWAQEHDAAAVPVIAAAVRVAASGSGSSARALDAAARSIRSGATGRRELEAWSTQARASAVLLAATPLVFAALALASRPRAVTQVLAQPPALGSIALGLAAEALGAWWMLRLVARAQGEA